MAAPYNRPVSEGRGEGLDAAAEIEQLVFPRQKPTRGLFHSQTSLGGKGRNVSGSVRVHLPAPCIHASAVEEWGVWATDPQVIAMDEAGDDF